VSRPGRLFPGPGEGVLVTDVTGERFPPPTGGLGELRILPRRAPAEQERHPASLAPSLAIKESSSFAEII